MTSRVMVVASFTVSAETEVCSFGPKSYLKSGRTASKLTAYHKCKPCETNGHCDTCGHVKHMEYFQSQYLGLICLVNDWFGGLAHNFKM